MKKLFFVAAVALFMIPSLLSAQTAKPERPKITGIAHIGLYTDDVPNAVQLFTDYFGFGKPYVFTLKSGTEITFVKVNDRQYIELFKDNDNRLVKYRHTAFETDDVEAMRLYLRSMGIVVPDSVTDAGLGFKSVTVQDFNGHNVEFLEYTDKGAFAADKGKNMPETRISDTFRHAGWICPDSAKDIAFYGYILGFTEFWRGGEKPDQINWIKMKVPDGTDYVELMLFDHDLDQQELGLYNHLDFDVDDVVATKAILDTRKLPEGCKPAENQSKGLCGYGLSNVYLKDQTRIELMTRIALGGTPTPSTYGKPLRYDGEMSHLLK